MTEFIKLTYEEARSAGLKHYWDANASCKHGHEPWCFVSTGKCVQCRRTAVARYTASHKKQELARLRQFKRDHVAKVRAANAIYREKNRTALRKYNSDYEKANRAQVSARKKRRRQEDLERCQARDAAYRKRESVRYRVHWAAWRADLLAATVDGLPEGWALPFYEEARRIGGDVDHIIPLRGCIDCGRYGNHEPANLQVLSSFENRSKKQRCQACWDAFKAAMEAA